MQGTGSELCVCVFVFVGAGSYQAVDMNTSCDTVCVESHLQHSASSWQLNSQKLALANVPSVLFEAYEPGKCVQLIFFLPWMP